MVKISIIIPTFNRKYSLEIAINSVLNQSFEDWEIILVDDGSTDGTFDFISSFLKNQKIKYFYQSNLGVSHARNTGASKAVGEWLVFLDSDDELETDCLKNLNNAFLLDPLIHLFIGNYSLNQGNPNGNFIVSNSPSFIAGAFAIKSNKFWEVGGYDVRLKFAENTDLSFSLSKKFTTRKNIPVSLFVYNQHLGEGNKNFQNVLYSLRIILEKHDHFLNPHVKHLYHQNIGVIEMRLRNWKKARLHLYKAWIFKPYKMATLGRLGIAFLPPLARTLYKPEVRK